MKIGIIKYKNKKCIFKLNKDFTLEIEEIENRDKILIDDFDFILSEKERCEELLPKRLQGHLLENGNEILFNVLSINKSGLKTHIASLNSYIIFDSKETNFDGIQINSEELNWFHNVEKSYDFTVDIDTGESKVKLKPFADTSHKFKFNFRGQLISSDINITRKYSNVSTVPIKLKTNLNLYFESTGDFTIVDELSLLTMKFLNFITYRQNTSINEIVIRKRNDKNGKYKSVGSYFINNFQHKKDEKEKILRERLIDLPLLGENLTNLFENIAKDKIYLKHIPSNSTEGRITTPSSIIMATAGFEWQYRFTHKGLNNRENYKYKEQEEEILSFLDEKIAENTGKRKKYIKGYKNLLLRSNMTLAEKIYDALIEFKDVLYAFISHLYILNGIDNMKYTEIAYRIQTERNNIAHGNIDKEFDTLVILDVIVLEWLYYSMVLSSIGISKENTKKAINKLFNRGINY